MENAFCWASGLYNLAGLKLEAREKLEAFCLEVIEATVPLDLSLHLSMSAGAESLAPAPGRCDN
jgi:hypothetical protein